MKDRVPVYPGRVKLVPVSGQENVYDMTRADQPTQEGTPLNKATFLKDATASLFGLGADSVPDDALALLSKAALYKTVEQAAGLYDVSDNLLLKLPGVQIATGSYVGTGTYGSSNPNSLTFEFEPKVVIISTEGNYTTAIGFPYIWGSAKMYTQRGSSQEACTVSVSGNTMNYYSDSDEYTQMNTNKQKYPYIALG